MVSVIWRTFVVVFGGSEIDLPHGNLRSSRHPKRPFLNRNPKNRLLSMYSTLLFLMTDLCMNTPTFFQVNCVSSGLFSKLRPNRISVRVSFPVFPHTPQKLKLPHAICGSGVLIFGGRGGILRTIAERSSYKSRIHQRFKLQIGHMNQIKTVPCQGAPKIDKNVDFLRSTDLDSEFENVVGIFNRLFWGRGGCGNRVVAVTRTTHFDCPKRRFACGKPDFIS